MDSKKVIDMLLGIALGDALGVPFEFKDSNQMELSPCTDMAGYGTHNQAPGTWSDDSSLTFCLAESLSRGFDLKDMAKRFIMWKKLAYWTAHEKVFDIGMTTSKSITQLEYHLEKDSLDDYLQERYTAEEHTNGNGSLMRILPLLVHIHGKKIGEQFNIIWDVSCLTHGHIRAAMSCLIYLKLAEYIIAGEQKIDAYHKMREDILVFWDAMDFSMREREHFNRIIQNDIRHLMRDELKSGGYVIESLEASIWCFLYHNTYGKAVIDAVNLGHDTDTTAAITGGLSALYYGLDVPSNWLEVLAKKDEIVDLGKRLSNSYKT